MHANTCRALSHPKRVEILNRLREGEKSVGALVDEMGISKSNVSQHLALLRQVGAVTFRRDGQTLYYRVANPKILQACDLMKQVLLERLETIEAIARGEGAEEDTK
jgi:ArsR family transcriptional regulator